MWTRRNFIQTSILSQIAISSGILSQLYACSPNDTSDQVVSAEVKEYLKAVMDEIIPAGEGMPSASETGGLNYLLKLVGQFPEQARKLSAGLTDLNSQCIKVAGRDFPDVTSDERIALLQQLERDNPSFFNQLRDYTYESYYLSPQVWKLIRYEPHPTLSSGPLMEAFDEKLLERVRMLPSLFKAV
jgi:hypothetical protein